MNIDLVLLQQVLAVAEIAREPGQLPERFRRAVEPGSDRAADQSLWLQHIETELIERLQLVPAIASALYPDEVQPFRDVIRRSRSAETVDLPFHAAPSWAF